MSFSGNFFPARRLKYLLNSKTHAREKFCLNEAPKRSPNSTHDSEMQPKWCKVERTRTKVVKNAFSWGFHFSAYNVCPDKSF